MIASNSNSQPLKAKVRCAPAARPEPGPAQNRGKERGQGKVRPRWAEGSPAFEGGKGPDGCVLEVARISEGSQHQAFHGRPAGSARPGRSQSRARRGRTG